jgi:hypothetical protein
MSLFKKVSSDSDIVFPLESFTIQEVIDYVIEHCVVNYNQFNFFRTGSKDSPVYTNPATYSENSDYNLGLYRGMGSIPLDRKEKGWYITYNGDFLLDVLTKYYTGDRLIRNHIKHGWDLSRPKSNGGNFYISYFDGHIYYVRKFYIPSQEVLKSNHPIYQIRISDFDFLKMSKQEIDDKYFNEKNIPHTKTWGYINSQIFQDIKLETWKVTSFIDTMFHFKLDPDLFYSNQFHFINWPFENPRELI